MAGQQQGGLEASTVMHGVAVIALWQAKFDSADIARLLSMSEADVMRILDIHRAASLPPSFEIVKR